MSKDTIYALGTGAGRAAIAVIRLSGPDVGRVVSDFAGVVPVPRRAAFTRFRDPAIDEILDEGLVLWLPAPGSTTGEDYAEFQIHGGRAVVDGFLGALAARRDIRPAEPGEFTRRAFANGKLDLSQVEALADLIEAQTAFQRRQALRVAGGALRREAEDWRAAVIDALALVESDLDFSDEGDVGALAQGRLAELLAPTVAAMERTLALSPASERMRDGFTVMILGRPNAGKSTLLNALAGRDMAIVSPTPGTTRDMIEAHLDIGGLPVTFVDTAGLRDPQDEIEHIGVARVFDRAQTADLALWLSDCGEEPEHAPPGVELLRVATKADISRPPEAWLPICAPTGAGLDALLGEVGARARDRMGDGGSALLIRARHREAVDEAARALHEALRDKPTELVAEDLRRAARAIGRITGEVDVEEVLDALFSRFCIGK